MRVQNPTLKQTKGRSPRWYIRPYVDRLDADGGLKRVKERIYLGSVAEMTKRQAAAKRTEVMTKINRTQYVVQSQLNFGTFLDHYLAEHLRKPGVFAASTQDKYENHIRNHIRPAFGSLMLAEVTTQRIDAFLADKATAGLSWATRTDLRNILSALFTQARKWGMWKEPNPVKGATVGRKRAVREKRKLTTEQTRKLVTSLPPDVRLICSVALSCALRISEVLGLMWKHVDLQRGVLMIRQRFYRGDLDEVKSERSRRDVPLGFLTNDLRSRYPGPGHEEAFVFSVATRRGICRDDRDIHQHFLRPAAEALGLYYPGFGFHAFRREGITEHAKEGDSLQAMRMAGHSRMDMTLQYELADGEAQTESVKQVQRRVLGLGREEPSKTVKIPAGAVRIGPQWAIPSRLGSRSSMGAGPTSELIKHS